ncbi:MAG TPA: hypothetical protein RMH99_03665, partial [Sandaracinaceae bacterium LLY-WYZ-13_1]|nr:hypothetical protein [Sandaracinaceae bacterium LLY-WYZ-13_1]
MSRDRSHSPNPRRRGASLACVLALATCGLVGCGGDEADPDPEPGAETPTAGDEATDRPAPAGPPDDVRQLSADATYSDLLRAARTLDDRRDQGSDAGCLLRTPQGGGAGFALAADLAVAVRPLRDAPEDLDARLATDGSAVNVLSRWGAYGPGDPDRPTFAAVTTTLPPRREPAIVWAVTDRGVYVRSTQRPTDAAPPGSHDDAAAALGDPAALGALLVTAERSVPLTRLAEVLAVVPPALAGRVALAVALEPGTRLPEPPEASGANGADALCPDGLPALAEDAPVGSLAPRVILSSLGPLRQGAEICVGTTGGAGGRVELALRIGPDGRVAEACVVRDETDGPALRA